MIIGTDSLFNKLNSISQKIDKQTTEKAVEKGTKRVQAAAKLLVPKNTGELRNSINTVVNTTAGHVEGIVYTNKQYAPFVEFGTGPRGAENHSEISPNITPKYANKGWSYKDENGKWIYTKGQAAKPYLYPALKNNEEAAVKIIISEIKKVIKEQI